MHYLRTVRFIFLLFITAHLPLIVNGQQVIFVRADATGNNDGSSWADAFATLQPALDAATSGDSIWISQGTYYPTQSPDGSATTATSRSNAFHFTTGIVVMGGFQGTESYIEQRDLSDQHTTLLSGDYNQDDLITGSGNTLAITNTSDNAYHVIVTAGTPAGAELNGLTIQGGIADNGIGSVVYNGSHFFNEYGGGLYNNNSILTVQQCVIQGNYATRGGGSFDNNTQATYQHCVFFHNIAGSLGGAILTSGNALLNHVTLSLNRSMNGRGIIFSAHNTLNISNAILWGNAPNGDLLEYNNVTAHITHSILEGSGGSTSWSTALGTDGGGNLDADPQFWNAAAGDFRIGRQSPAFDAGQAGATTDLLGTARPQNLAPNMGAYEFNITRFYVDASATGNNDGTTWTDAFADLQEAIFRTTPGDSLWIAGGTYLPQYTPGNTSPTPNSASNAFHIAHDISLFGGFAGTETDFSQRPALGSIATFLSGDFNQNDLHSGSGATLSIDPLGENVYQVLITVGLSPKARLDRLIVTGGETRTIGTRNYLGYAIPLMYGAGMIHHFSSPTITHCQITYNKSFQHGGGVANIQGSPTYLDCYLDLNFASGRGGAIYNDATGDTILFDRCVLVGNRTNDRGGAVETQNGTVILANSLILNNDARLYGGVSYAVRSSSKVHFINNTIVGNSARLTGGAIRYFSAAGGSIINCIFQGNNKRGDTSVNGADIETATPASLTVRHCITQTYGTHQVDGNLVGVDPQFDPNGGYIPQATSPAINAGDSTAIPWGIRGDITGNVRIADDNVDIGAFETNSIPLPVELIVFTARHTDAGNLLTWTTASERNNAGFEVQASLDGRTFRPIGWVNGGGTTTTPQHYHYTEEDATLGLTYYRLLQHDHDGTTTYSSIVTVYRHSETPILRAFPNPMRDYLTLHHAQGEATLFDMLGQIIWQRDIQHSEVHIPVGELTTGRYLLHIQRQDGQSSTQVLIK